MQLIPDETTLALGLPSLPPLSVAELAGMAGFVGLVGLVGLVGFLCGIGQGLVGLVRSADNLRFPVDCRMQRR